MRNLFLFLWLLFSSYGHYYLSIFLNGKINDYHFLFGSLALAECLAIAAGFYMVIYTVEPNRKLQKKDLCIFSVPFVQLGHYLYVFNIPVSEKRTFIENALNLKKIEFVLSNTPVQLNIIFILSIWAFVSFFIVKKINWAEIENKGKKYPFKELLFSGLFIIAFQISLWLLYYVFILLERDDLAEQVLYFEVAEFMFLTLFIQFIPYLVKLGVFQRKYEKNLSLLYVNSKLQNIDKSKIKQKLEILMKKKKIFRDEFLTLEVLAKELQITRSQLSEYLNGSMNMSFREFINLYRIEDAKKILKKNPDINSSNVAFEVGYNSVSTFYDVFKKITGYSPDVFRKNNVLKK